MDKLSKNIKNNLDSLSKFNGNVVDKVDLSSIDEMVGEKLTENVLEVFEKSKRNSISELRKIYSKNESIYQSVIDEFSDKNKD